MQRCRWIGPAARNQGLLPTLPPHGTLEPQHSLRQFCLKGRRCRRRKKHLEFPARSRPVNPPALSAKACPLRPHPAIPVQFGAGRKRGSIDSQITSSPLSSFRRGHHFEKKRSSEPRATPNPGKPLQVFLPRPRRVVRRGKRSTCPTGGGSEKVRRSPEKLFRDFRASAAYSWATGLHHRHPRTTEDWQAAQAAILGRDHGTFHVGSPDRARGGATHTARAPTDEILSMPRMPTPSSPFKELIETTRCAPRVANDGGRHHLPRLQGWRRLSRHERLVARVCPVLEPQTLKHGIQNLLPPFRARRQPKSRPGLIRRGRLGHQRLVSLLVWFSLEHDPEKGVVAVFPDKACPREGGGIMLNQ